jgi:glutathione peroxidase-family protein
LTKKSYWFIIILKGENGMNSEKQEELIGIIEKFANSGWDLIDFPAKTWLQNKFESDRTIVQNLIDATERADIECGNCGCEYDPLYKKVLQLKDILVA